jgi:RNA polymerase sigma-70 factor (ECF subfamily)
MAGKSVDEAEIQNRLSRISTCWSLVAQAHRDPQDTVGDARRLLMQRYFGAVYRYLLGALRDADAADEVAQEFALRFARGAFRGADPQRGRFRDFVKTALYHLIVDYHRERRRQAGSLPSDSGFLAQPPAGPADEEFTRRWREELLDRAWEALAEDQERTGRLSYTVLRWRAENPQGTAAELAERLAGDLGRSFTEAGIRQTLHRARERFADLLIDEVARSLENPELEQLEQELTDLGLLSYCRPALAKRK